MDEMPDYRSYTLAQLYDAESHVNREKFPERYEAVRREIESRDIQPHPKGEFNEIEYKSRVAGISDGLSVGFAVFLFSALSANFGLIDGIEPSALDFGLALLFSIVAGAIVGSLSAAHVRRKSR